jgi:hypothetical protein
LPPINSVLTCDYDLIFPQLGWVFQSLPSRHLVKP